MASSPPTATLVQVARLANVSPMTVSRVLAGGHHVSSKLQTRVMAAVEELGYRRNEYAHTLRTGSGSGLVGVALTNIANPYYAQLILGVEDIARANGRRLLLGTTDEDESREAQLVDDFVGRQVEGLIVVPTGGRRHLAPNRLAHLPIVLATRTVPGVRADVVLVDDIGGAYESTVALLTDGRRRIAFLGNSESVSTSRRRLEGFQLAHEDLGVAIDPALVKLGGQSLEQARDSALSLLAEADPPDAFFASNNRNAAGVLTALAQTLGIHPATARAPGLAFFDRFDLAEFVPWPMVLVVHDPREVGRIAARMLFDRLAGDEDTWMPRSVQVPTRLVRLPVP